LINYMFWRGKYPICEDKHKTGDPIFLHYEFILRMMV
jgi:hypothetical protein